MKLKEYRKRKSLTQEEISKLINVAPSTYRGYESNSSEPTIETLIKLADIFNISLDELCDRPWNNKIGYIPESKTELINNVLSLNDNETKELMIFIKGLKAGRSSSSDFKIFN